MLQTVIHIERHRSEPTTEDLEVHTVVDMISDNLDLFLQAETSKIHFSELVSHMDIPPYCIESMALKLTDMAKKAHEVGKKILRNQFDVLILVEEDNYEEVRVAEAQRESMDLAYQGRASAVPPSRSSVEALERMVFDKGKSDEIKCTICLNDFSTGMKVIRMPVLTYF
ncbi:uncharacterized protein LOC131234630 [Magnolia sinica]|uniref:uncharacterized protein LOC131234630 n=1 Tax=Magnolia sinica TaxID=86752 RepID=UPI0026592CD1|nr:uncharacterized protein LOC131234630 [Magnolia sinica]